MRSQSSAGSTAGGRIPADLIFALAVTAALNVAVFVPVVRETPLRVPLGLLFVCVVPGYAFVAALFPETAVENEWMDTGPVEAIKSVVDSASITVAERFVLAVGCSVVLVPGVGYLLNFTPWGVRLVPMLLALTGFTVVTAFVGWGRRLRLQPERRFRIGEHVAGLRRSRPTTGEETSTVVTALLVGSVAFFALSSGYAIVGGAAEQGSSELYLLTEGGEELVDSNLSAPVRESRDLQLGVSNHEGRPVTYTVVVIGQQVETADGEREIRERTQLGRFELSVSPGESRTVPTEVPVAAAESDRVAWLLFDGDVPDTPSVQSAPYHAHLWLDGAAAGADGEQEELRVGTVPAGGSR